MPGTTSGSKLRVLWAALSYSMKRLSGFETEPGLLDSARFLAARDSVSSSLIAVSSLIS